MFERMLRGHPKRGIYRLMRMLAVLSCELGGCDCEHVGSAAETIGEEQDVNDTSRRDQEGAAVIDADGNARPSGRGR